MAVVLLASGAAAADPDPDPNLAPYPQLYVDRPLLYGAGMTVVDVGVDAPTYRYGDSSSTRLGEYIYPDLVVLHSFGGIQLAAKFAETPGGPYVEGRGRFYAGPGAVTFDASTLLPNSMSGVDSSFVESAGYVIKANVVPHVLALSASASVALYEVSPKDYPSYDPMFASLGGGGTLQLLPELAFGAGAGVSTPILETDSHHTSLYASAMMTYVYRRFDVYGFVRAEELQHAPLPFVGGGVIVRFGP